MNRHCLAKKPLLDKISAAIKRSAKAGYKISGTAGIVLLAVWAGRGLPYSFGTFSEELDRSSVPSVSDSDNNADLKNDSELQDLITTLRKGDSYKKQQAAIALGASGDTRAVDPLITALNDDDSFVRDFAVRSLGRLGDARAVDPLIKMLNDENSLVRRSAAISLGNLGDRKAVDPLITALNSNNFMVKRAIIEALGRLGDPKAVPSLIQTLSQADVYTQGSAVDALVNIGKPAVPKLVDALSDWTAGPGIAEILKRLQWEPSTDEEKVYYEVAIRNKQSLLNNWPITKKILVTDTNSEKGNRMYNAVFALIGIGRDEVVDELIRILNEKGSLEMAGVFLNCGNDTLRKAARNWAVKHGDPLNNGNTDRIVEWGRMEPVQD